MSALGTSENVLKQVSSMLASSLIVIHVVSPKSSEDPSWKTGVERASVTVCLRGETTGFPLMVSIGDGILVSSSQISNGVGSSLSWAEGESSG
jgi:hypothetical protein